MDDDRAVAHADPGVMARVAAWARMTEGQLYTAIIAVFVVLLLSLTGLPTAQRSPGGNGIPTLGGPVTTVTAP